MRTFTTLLILSVISASLFLTISPQQAKAGSDIAPDKFENKPFATLLPETMDGDPPFSIVNGRLVANGDSEEEKTLVSKFNNIQDDNLRTTTLGYIGEVLADTNLSDLRKRVIVNAYMNAALGDGNVVSRRAQDIGPKYKTYLTKIEEMAGGDGEIGIDADPFADFDVASEELEADKKALAEAKARFEQSVIDLQNANEDWNETRDALIQSAKNYIKAGGNPADAPNWEETSEKFNISPDDLAD